MAARAAAGCSRSPGSATTLGRPVRGAYAGGRQVGFAGMQYRRDIGWRAPGAALASYAAAGVDIAEGNRAVAQMRDAVERTHGAEVVRGVGSFGGAFSAKAIAAMDDPVLVASTDGVGTKVELAASLGRVARSRPRHRQPLHRRRVRPGCPTAVLPRLLRDEHARRRTRRRDRHGMAAACAAAGCALLGGETAEMPGVYRPAHSTSPARSSASPSGRRCSPADVTPGDCSIGIASSGPHTNGFSLLRELFAWMPMDVAPPGLDRPLGDALLEPHRNYLPVLQAALATGGVKALAHITGGGLSRTSRGCSLTTSTPSSTSARGRCRRCSASCASWPRRSTTRSCTAP